MFRILRKLLRKKVLFPVLVVWGFCSYVFEDGCNYSANATSSMQETFQTTQKQTKKSQVTKNDINNIYNYAGQSSVVINNGIPFFDKEDIEFAINNPAYEDYGKLDDLGRCSSVIACLCKDTMPLEDEERGAIGMIKPTGWHTVKYDCIEDLYLYNRCHLIGWQLGAENDNECNLITGTRYMNLEMLDSENKVAKYIRKTGNHVLYRVSPIFYEDNLLCQGLLIEAQSLEDDEICFCKFYYNVQPGIEIDYETGESYKK